VFSQRRPTGVGCGDRKPSFTVFLLVTVMSKLRGVVKSRHIAAGFFGEVWQGEWEGVPVAIKVAKGASPKAVEALLREVEVAMSIKLHPNLVAVYGVCDGTDGELQLVLEYCEDGALPDWLCRLDKVCGARQRAGGGACERPRKTFRATFWRSLLTHVCLYCRVVCRSRCCRRSTF
jgi:hypothetical protein